MIPATSPSLDLLPKHKRRFPFSIDCTTAELVVWHHLAEQLADDSVLDTAPVSPLLQGEQITKGQLREYLAGAVRLHLTDTEKKPSVRIGFLGLFPHVHELHLGPPLYQGGKYYWDVQPSSVASQIQSVQIGELSGNWEWLHALTGCRKLKFWRCRIDNFHFLKECAPLTELNLGGCTIRSFEGLSDGSVRDLYLNEPHGACEQIDDCVNIRGLTKLDVFASGKFTRFPSCRKSSVQEVHLTRCLRLRDLQGLAEAPQLRSVRLSETPADQPRYLTPLAGHPTLKHVDLFMMSLAKFRKCKAILGNLIPETEDEFVKMRNAIR